MRSCPRQPRTTMVTARGDGTDVGAQYDGTLGIKVMSARGCVTDLQVQ